MRSGRVVQGFVRIECALGQCFFREEGACLSGNVFLRAAYLLWVRADGGLRWEVVATGFALAEASSRNQRTAIRRNPGVALASGAR